MLAQDEVTPNKELGLKYQLEKAKHDNEELKNAKDNLEKEYAAEKAAQQQATDQSRRPNWISRRRTARACEAGRAALDKEKSDAVAAMKATQTNATDYRKQRDKQRTDLAQAQKDRDEHFKEVVRLTDDSTRRSTRRNSFGSAWRILPRTWPRPTRRSAISTLTRMPT